ncbi:hypothetical protein ACFL2R_00315 [Patescibacteria group bacterium]
MNVRKVIEDVPVTDEILNILSKAKSEVGNLLLSGNEEKLIKVLEEYSSLSVDQISTILVKKRKDALSVIDLATIHIANGKRIRQLRDIGDREWFQDMSGAADTFLEAERRHVIERADLILIQNTFYYI